MTTFEDIISNSGINPAETQFMAFTAMLDTLVKTYNDNPEFLCYCEAEYLETREALVKWGTTEAIALLDTVAELFDKARDAAGKSVK